MPLSFCEFRLQRPYSVLYFFVTYHVHYRVFNRKCHKKKMYSKTSSVQKVLVRLFTCSLFFNIYPIALVLVQNDILMVTFMNKNNDFLGRILKFHEKNLEF